MTMHKVAPYDFDALNLARRLVTAASSARQRYMAEVASDGQLGLPAVLNYRQRMKRSGLGFTLGEAAPLVFWQLYPIPGRSVEALAHAWAYLYHHALVLDDLTDGDLSDTRAHHSLSAALLDRSMIVWHETMDGFAGGLDSAFGRYYAEQIAAGNSPVGDAESLGHRSALVKYLLAVLLAHGTGEIITRTHEEAVESLLAGFQILDDVTDRQEDRAHGAASILVDEEPVITGGRAAALLRRGLALLAAPDSAHIAIFVNGYIRAIDDAVGRFMPETSGTRRPGQIIILPKASN
ncbi:MAG TPA: hypothetical protein VLC46_11965 [Thermoanaerobaculia bacterium]|jgi:hypothetical protein|nr:hypothetical protein [Thermoanaerobaculia bacterium]